MKLQSFIPAAGSLGLVATPGVADSYEGFGHMMWGGGFGMFGGLMMVAVWALIIGLIVFAVRGFSNRPGAGDGQNATDILRERYARGEIDEDEFERRLARLDAGKR